MKNITFSADEKLIANARAVATAQNRTLNEAFREWLADFSAERREAASSSPLIGDKLTVNDAFREWLNRGTPEQDVREYNEYLAKRRHVDLGGPYTRDEMNER
jgi:hypothetical protein